MAEMELTHFKEDIIKLLLSQEMRKNYVLS